MIEGRPRESLVVFENPIEVSTPLLHSYQSLRRSKAARIHSTRALVSAFAQFGTQIGQLIFETVGTKRNQLPPMENKPSNEDILNAILPPREWVEGGKHFIQYVSHQPASRVDVARLREMLDQKLMERQARESGICPVREELFSQCFDEIIRQVTLSEPERGLLLLRVREEIKMTISAYQTLYQSSVTFAMRKQLQAEHGKADLEKTIE